MKIIIPVAGEGKRLRPHTHTKPKPLIPVAGKAALDHIMDKLIPLKATEYVFVTGHLKDRIEDHLKHAYPKLKMRFVAQETATGTAIAVNLARDAFDEDILIDFGDTIFDADLSIIKKCKEDGIIWAMPREDYQRFGVIVVDEQGHATKIVEKPALPISKLANIGLYYIKNTRLFAEGIDFAIKNRVEGKEVFLTTAFEYMIEKGAKLKIVPCKGWYDTGTPEALLETNQILLENMPQKHKQRSDVVIIPPVSIHATAHLENATIGPFVSVGAHASIVNSSIRNSILDQQARVEDSILTDSVLGAESVVVGNASRVIIGDHSRIEGLTDVKPLLHKKTKKK